MGDPRLSRVDDTLKSLFESLIPAFGTTDTNFDLDVHINQAIEAAKETVHAGHGVLPSEVNQAQDLIKKKLLRENASPEKAARFSNLYSRLLSIPVLSQKWSILYLLYNLSEDSTADGLRSPLVDFDHPLDPPQPHSQRLRSPATPPYTKEQGATESPPPSRDRNAHSKPGVLRRNIGDAGFHTGLEKAANVRVAMSVLPQTSNHQHGPSESELLRDLPFNLQGLSSSHIQFTSITSVSLPASLPVPIVSLLHTLAEPCLLYRQLNDFATGQDGSLVNQSLRAAISSELRSYLSLVATLEGEIRRAVSAIEHGEDKKLVRMAGVTLKRCVIWTRDATMGLRLMSLVVEEAKQKRGGQIISLVHGLASSHGDPFVGSFADRLLVHVARPFYEMLRHWIYDGELIDPYHEFFVTEPDPNSKADVDPRRVSTSIWEDKYKLDSAMVPTIVSPDFAKKVFLIGKSLNFIRHSCSDSDWVIQYSKTHSKSLDHSNTATLSSSIDTAYATTMSRLTELMSAKFGLYTHLAAIKKYLLLSQGDFIELLMESLAPNLDRPANSQYRHTLTSQLEHAIRHSNAQYDDPEVLRRLDARMLELSAGDTGWDSFTLEYKISAPCDVIITQWANTQYLKVFHLLWRIKRVEFSLNMTWRRCMTGSRSILAAVNDKLGQDWKRARCVIAEMVHFINQLQYYLLFEVIEASWEALQAAIRKPEATLDDLIEAHTKFVNSITHKGLLGKQRHDLTGHRDDSFTSQLHYILKGMLNYRDAVDGLYSFSVAEYTKRQQFSAKIEQRTAQGKWGMSEKDLIGDSRSSTPIYGASAKSSKQTQLLPEDSDSPLLQATLITGDDQTLLESLRSRLRQLSADFKTQVNVLLYDLAHQPDVDMRFLGIVMNFNEVYKPVNTRRRQARRDRERKEMDRQSRETSAATQSEIVPDKALEDARPRG